MRKTILAYIAVVLITLSAPAFAQETSQQENKSQPAGHFYHLTYTVEELSESGKIINTRTYATNLEIGGGPAQIRVGNRVPISTGSGQFNQFQYFDFGINIDSNHAIERNGKLALEVTAEMNDAISSSSQGVQGHPTVRQNKWSANVLVPIGKPTVIFSSDNLQDKGKVQVELTATRVE
jgi:hypothetical protein